tara:strand:+ start:830 stop:1273 length:444 start_codon:yes stop_codon:yes gene_type:complete
MHSIEELTDYQRGELLIARMGIKQYGAEAHLLREIVGFELIAKQIKQVRSDQGALSDVLNSEYASEICWDCSTLADMVYEIENTLHLVMDYDDKNHVSFHEDCRCLYCEVVLQIFDDEEPHPTQRGTYNDCYCESCSAKYEGSLPWD